MDDGLDNDVPLAVDELGLTGTHFTNPTGLHDPDHYSTCADIAKILSEVHRIPLLHEIMTAASYTDEAGFFMTSTVYRVLTAQNITIAGYDGGKTGYTNAAGHCLASYITLNGMNLIVVTAHAMTPYADYAHIRDTASVARWLSEEYSRRQVLTPEQVVQTVTFDGMFTDTTKEIQANAPIWFDLNNAASVTCTTDIPSVIAVDVKDREYTGTITVCADGVPIASQQVSFTVPKEPKWYVRFLMRVSSLFGGKK